jgi:predicted metal-dependent HD superfamily phosphohydrolase
MAKSEIISATEQYVSELLSTKLAPNIHYHNLHHTLAVRNSAMQIASMSGLDEQEKEIVEISCLMHDVGMTETYQEHEAASARIAEAFLKSKGYPEDKITLIKNCIAVTKPSSKPQGLLQEVVRDADYGHLGSSDYSEQLDRLRLEWADILGQSYEEKKWYELNLDFIKNHEYYTPAAKMIFEAMKELNRKRIKKWVKEGRSEKEGGPSEEARKVSIVESRSSQMMFKTSLRNHMDLSNLADNKANMMLSTNALIITFALPLLVSQIRQHPEFTLPFAMVLGTCLASMVFATLATVPMKMTGLTPLENIKAGKSNLFFFGNFYSMQYEEYKKGIQIVTSLEENLEDSIMRDLFFLGKSLGRKYRQLRICYIIFMVGILAAVAVAGVTEVVMIFQGRGF